MFQTLIYYKKVLMIKRFYLYSLILFAFSQAHPMYQLIVNEGSSRFAQEIITGNSPSSFNSALNVAARIGFIASVLWLWTDAYRLITDGNRSLMGGYMSDAGGKFRYGNPALGGVPFNTITPGATGIYRTNDGTPLTVVSAPVLGANNQCIAHQLKIGGLVIQDSRDIGRAGMLPGPRIRALSTSEYKNIIINALAKPLACGLISFGTLYFTKKYNK
jgi:hypothetical protein